ncbi:unnamed protein product [Trypanosoma congolense IL3000]|uniref:WGS project CAEQ00000000 data, annotated contig 1204 n=1 Tax=Trypanosoma congolense (strain IL3000) TaxID=1068625 RepID=F9W4M3_TRYCI|nr:unnamed protein product [Trypanosoma congolense IL3000]
MNMGGEREAVPNWTMEGEVEQVLIQECSTQCKINLSYFFVEYYGWTVGEFRHLTFGELFKRPAERYLEDANRHKKVKKDIQHMLERLHDNTIKDVRYLVGDGIITLRDWALRGPGTLLDRVPRGNLDEAVREACKQPRPPITSGSMSVQRSNEASDKLAHQVAGNPSTQRQPGGTKDNEPEEILCGHASPGKTFALLTF